MDFKRKHHKIFLEAKNKVSKKIKTINCHTKTKILKQCFIYCRVSTKEQSIESQQYSCIKFCEENGYNVINIITESCSARKMKSQQKLVKCLKENNNITIIVNSVDRFSRNLNECFKMCDIMKKNNINLISVTDHIDLSTAYGQHSFRTRVSIAQLESDTISERVRRTINYKREKGLCLSTRTKYGYKIEKGIKFIDTNEQAVIHFVNRNLYKKMSSTEFSQELYKLMKIFNKPYDFYVPVVFEENDTQIQFMKITPKIMADILNDYEILRRNKEWTISSIKNINSINNITIDFMNIHKKY